MGVLQPPADTLKNPWWIEPEILFQFVFGGERNKNRFSFPTPPPPVQKKKRKKNNKIYQALRGLTNKSPVGWGAIVLAWSAIPNKLRVV